MNNTDELKQMVSEYNTKKSVLDNGTGEIVKEIRKWCIAEDKRLTEDINGIISLITENWSLFEGKFVRDRGSWDYRGLQLVGEWDDDHNPVIKEFKYNSEFSNRYGLGISSRLPQPKNLSSMFVTDMGSRTEDSLDFWLDMKKVLAIRKEELSAYANEIKYFISALISNENERYEYTMEACKDLSIEIVK